MQGNTRGRHSHHVCSASHCARHDAIIENDNLAQTFLTLSGSLPVSAWDSECKVERLRHEHFESTKRSTASSASGRSARESLSVFLQTRHSYDFSRVTCMRTG